MSVDIIPIALLFTVAFFVVFYIAQLISEVTDLSQEISRKFAHVFCGIISLFFPFYIQSEIFMILYTTSFTVFFYIAKQKKVFSSITQPNRKTYGSWLFPLAILVSYIAYFRTNNLMFFLLPMLILTFSDSLASLLGSKWPIKTYSFFGQNKSLGGSLIFFLCSFLILLVYTNFSIPLVIGFAFTITIVEAVSVYGSDNLTIPLSVIGLLLLKIFPV